MNGRILPTLLVLAVLGSVAFVGHRAGWAVPKFSELIGNGRAAKGDWCTEHNVPESQCVECRPELLPYQSFGWCKKHGVQDCPWEHPEVAQLKVRPTITPADLARAQRALDFVERSANNPKCKLHARRVQFASREALEKQGIEPDQVQRARIEETITASGEVGYDQTRVASLATPVAGRVWRVEKEIGQPVRPGDVLALVDAAEVGKARAELLQAIGQAELRHKAVESMRPYVGGAIPEARFREAETSLQEAQIRVVGAQQALINLGLPVRADELKGLGTDELARRIAFLGLPEDIVRTFEPRTTTANLIPVRAPLEGVIVARKAVAGEQVDPTKPLFVVADPRRLWLMLHVRLEDTRSLALGQLVRFRPDGGFGETSGKVAWISTAVDERTRTVEVRAELDNANGKLRANTFGLGTVLLREEAQAIVVPNEAVHWEGNCHVVFVYDKDSPRKDAPKVFHARSVRLGAKDEQHTEIIAGVLPGEMIATKNSGVLRAELLKSNLGAG